MMSKNNNTEQSMSFEEKLKRFMKESGEIQNDKKIYKKGKVSKKRKKLPTHGLEDI